MGRQVTHVETVTTTNIVTTDTSTPFTVARAKTVSVQSVVDVNTPAAKTFVAGTSEVQTLTYDTKANTVNGDYLVLEDTTGTKWAVALVKPVAEVQTLTVPNGTGAAADGDYCILTDGVGGNWGFAFDTTGGNLVPPTGAAYVALAAGRKTTVDISAAANSTAVADAIRTALNLLSGFSAKVTLSGTSTVIATMVDKAPCTNPVVIGFDGVAAATAFSGAETTAGVASQTPTGAAWTAVGASNKGLADISADTTAAQVAARAETAWNALTGFSAVITSDDTAADGTMTMTQVVRNPATNPVSKTYNDSGAGSATGVQTTAGVASTVDVSANTITAASHGYTTGLKCQTSSTGTLPAGITTATDYFVISVDANTIKLATSLANAQAGTAIDLTDQGTNAATHTVTPTSLAGASLTLQKSNDYSPVTGSGTWDAVEAATSITADGDVWISDTDPEYLWARLSYTLTAGRLSASAAIVVKADD